MSLPNRNKQIVAVPRRAAEFRKPVGQACQDEAVREATRITDRVGTIPERHTECVIAIIPDKKVVAAATIQRIVAGTADQRVITSAGPVLISILRNRSVSISTPDAGTVRHIHGNAVDGAGINQLVNTIARRRNCHRRHPCPR